MRWQLVSREALTYRDLDGQRIVYNAATGSTHLFEPLAAELLNALLEADGESSFDDLMERVAQTGSPPLQWRDAIETVLREFERLGIAQLDSNDRR